VATGMDTQAIHIATVHGVGRRWPQRPFWAQRFTWPTPMLNPMSAPSWCHRRLVTARRVSRIFVRPANSTTLMCRSVRSLGRSSVIEGHKETMVFSPWRCECLRVPPNFSTSTLARLPPYTLRLSHSISSSKCLSDGKLRCHVFLSPSQR
jgi:hypothetical protein